MSSEDGSKSPEKIRKGAWQADEIEKFEAALEKYGRDFNAITNAVGTRTMQQVRERSKWHFLKLLKDGQLLPAKVQESGSGSVIHFKPLKHALSLENLTDIQTTVNP